MNSKYLGVGIQDFEKMIKGNFIYVDKTEFIYEMTKMLQGFYFLARPRRFGKSLLVSTLEHFFKGEKELFKDLMIGRSDWVWKEYPVVKIDFNSITFETPDQLQENLILYVRQLSENNGIQNTYHSLKESFGALITGLFQKYKEPVAVLVDEYDKPLIDYMGKGEDKHRIAKGNRDKLKQFFGVLKGSDVSACLRFVFITGISKFARVSIFSDLNNLDDISMNKEYSTLLGYTHEEMQTCFAAYIQKVSKDENIPDQELIAKIRNWYNGYRFTTADKHVYNPFSVIKFFKTGEFKNYWFETGTPSFLINLIKKKNYPVPDIESMKLPEELFTVYDIDHLQLEPLLFQTGYITIKDYEYELYTMEYPNREVKTSFLAYILNDFVRLEGSRFAGVYKLLQLYLKEKKIEIFIESVKSVLGSIPYAQIAGQDEAYYHTVFFLMLSASGVSVHTEVLTSRGRMDIAVEFEDKVYLIELKCNQSSQKAIDQIIEKKYYEKYMQTGADIYLMGINFDTEKRSIDDWQWRELGELLMNPKTKKKVDMTS